MPGRTTFAAAVLALTLGTATARADSITITGGFIVVSSGIQGPASMSVTGNDGFSMNATLSRQSRVDARACGNWMVCGPGTVIPLGAAWSGLDLFGAVATFEGVTYPQVGGANSPNQMGFELAGSATAPAFSAGSAVQVQSPFSLDGTFMFGPSLTEPATTLDLSGGGIATLNLTRGAGDLANTWVFDGVRYDFQPSDVPEPASLILLGSGLAVVARKIRRAR